MGEGIIGIVLVGTQKALGVGVGMDGAGAGGLHGKLPAWVHGAVEGVLGSGREGALCWAQCAGVCGQGAGGRWGGKRCLVRWDGE